MNSHIDKFSRAAKFYTENALVQNSIADNLLSNFLLEEEFDEIYEIACGSGYLTKELERKFPKAKIYSCDLSKEMLSQAKAQTKNVSFFLEDARAFVLNRINKDKSKKKLIISSSSLQWILDKDFLIFEDIFSTLSSLDSFVFSLMTKKTFRELHSLKEELYGIKEEVFFSNKEIRTVLIKIGFEIKKELVEIRQKTFNTAKSFFSYIKSLGISGGERFFSKKMTAPKLRTLIDKYQDNFKSNRASLNVKASYAIYYCSLKRK